MRSLVLFALAGCRFGFDSVDPTGDARGDGVTDDGGLAVSCNGIDRVRDDFQDGVEDIALWGAAFANPGTSYREESGELVLVPATDMADAFVGHKTFRYYDLRGGRMVAQVNQVAAGAATTGLQAEVNGMDYVGISQQSGLLRAFQNIGNTFQQYSSVPYDPVAHRFWAVGERAGRIYFETSDDGITFVPLTDVPAPLDVSLARFMLVSGTNAMVAAPGEARFESAGVAGAASADACPATMLVDRFDDGVIGRNWGNSYSDACCTQTESTGVVTFTTDGSAVGNVTRRSSSGFDLRGNQFSVTLVMQPTVANTTMSLAARRDDFNTMVLEMQSTQTVARVVVNNVPTATMAARVAGENHLRIRESGGMIFFDISADNMTWRNLRMVPAPFAVDDVTAALRLGVNGASTPDQGSFDDFNVP